MSIALSIAFTGLCALIADGNGNPGQILLLDAKGVGEVGGVTLPEHAPTLVVSLNDLANPESSGPARDIAARPDQMWPRPMAIGTNSRPTSGSIRI